MNMFPYFKSMIDMDRCAVVICNLEHRIIYMNPAACARYAKRGGAGLVGKSLLDCHNAVSGERIRKVLDWFRQSGNHNIFIVVAMMMSAFALCCILYSLNQRQQRKVIREREAERERYNKELTEALHAAQLASNAKTMFLSNMSHDIRTPMNAVIGFTTLLEKDAENPDKVREYTKKIMASGQHLLSLINDILEVSKIESGKDRGNRQCSSERRKGKDKGD